MRRQAGFGLVLAALAGVAAPVGAVELQESTFCGDDHYFTIDEPKGWVAIQEPEGQSSLALGMGRTFGSRPPGGTPGGEGVAVGMRVMPSEYTAPDADPRDGLAAELDMLTMAGAEFSELRALKLAHPSMPSAAVHVIGDRGHLYLVAVAVPRGGGTGAVLTFATANREASPEELGMVKAMLASFRYDVDHSCYPDADGVAQKRPLERSPWRADERHEATIAADRRSSARLGYSPLRAAQACRVREHLFVPIACRATELDGEPVFLVDSRGVPGMPQTDESLAGHARQIAIRWCFETRAASAPPALVFATSEAETYQAFDCKAMRLGASFRGKQTGVPANAR